MDTMLEILGWSAFGLAIVVGLILNLVGFFGNWVIVAAVSLAYLATGREHFGLWGIAAMIVFGLIGEVIEFLMAGFGAKRFGGSKGSMWAALAGCIIGAIVGSPFLLLIGSLVGACVGAFIAAALWEYLRHEKAIEDSLWTGLGASLGKIGGIAAKFGCGVAILLIALFTYN